MHESPEVAIVQHGSGVMQVVNNMFEDGSESSRTHIIFSFSPKLTYSIKSRLLHRCCIHGYQIWCWLW
jgi:hypothetical protein